MPSLLVEVGVPATTFLLMTVVGLELTEDDFRRVARYPGAVLAATVGQVLLLPLLASGLILALRPPASVAAGMILMAACPPALLSSVYVSLVGGDIALSVTLNATFDLLSVVTLPLVLAVGLAFHLGEGQRVQPPILLMMGQLLVLILLPIGVGMLLRRGFPRAVESHRAGLQRLSLVVLVALMGGFLWTQASLFTSSLLRTVAAAALFTLLAMAGGWVTGWVLLPSGQGRFAVAFVFASRSVAVATVVGVSLLHRPDFLLFGTVFFLTHTACMLLTIAAVRRGYSRDTRALLPIEKGPGPA